MKHSSNFEFLVQSKGATKEAVDLNLNFAYILNSLFFVQQNLEDKNQLQQVKEQIDLIKQHFLKSQSIFEGKGKRKATINQKAAKRIVEGVERHN